MSGAAWGGGPGGSCPAKPFITEVVCTSVGRLSYPHRISILCFRASSPGSCAHIMIIVCDPRPSVINLRSVLTFSSSVLCAQNTKIRTGTSPKMFFQCIGPIMAVHIGRWHKFINPSCLMIILISIVNVLPFNWKVFEAWTFEEFWAFGWIGSPPSIRSIQLL